MTQIAINSNTDVLLNINRFEYDSYDNQILVYAQDGRTNGSDSKDSETPYFYIIHLDSEPYAQQVLNLSFEVGKDEKTIIENIYNHFNNKLDTDNEQEIVDAMNDFINTIYQVLL